MCFILRGRDRILEELVGRAPPPLGNYVLPECVRFRIDYARVTYEVAAERPKLFECTKYLFLGWTYHRK